MQYIALGDEYFAMKIYSTQFAHVYFAIFRTHRTVFETLMKYIFVKKNTVSFF